MKAINHKKHNQKVLCMVSVLFILIFTLSGCNIHSCIEIGGNYGKRKQT